MSRNAPATVSVLVALLLAASAPVAQRREPYRDPPRTAADSLTARVEPLFVASQYDSILSLAAYYIRLAEATGDSALLGRAFTQRGRIALIRGERANAEHDLDLGIRIAEACRDTTGLMPAIHFKGFLYRTFGNKHEAMKCFQRRLLLAQRTGSLADEAWARNSMALEYHLLGKHEIARSNFERAIKLARETGIPSLETTATIGLGRVMSAIGKESEAVRCYQRAWVLSRETGDKVNEMWATNNLGVLEENRGDLSRASLYQQRAYALARELKQPYVMVIPAVNIADRAGELGDFEGAKAILREMRQMCTELGAESFLPMLDYRLVELELEQGRYRSAGALLRPLMANPEKLEPQNREFSSLAMAEILAASDSVSQAIALVTDRLRRHEKAAYSDWVAQAHLLLSRFYLEQDNPRKALAHAVGARESAQYAGQRRRVFSAMLRESVCRRLLGENDAATQTFYAALDSIEAFRGVISTAEWREIYGQGVSRGVVEAGRVLLDREEAFFDAMQRVKTRTLLDRITEPRFGAEEIEGRWSRRVATLSDLQAVLQPGEAVLDFYVGSDQSYLAAVTTDSLRVIELPGPESPLAERVRLFRSLLASADPALREQYPADRMATMQRALGQEVVGGVADVIETSTRVFVAPDDYFAAIPFGILVARDGGRELMADRDIVQVPSASVLVLQRAIQRVECVSNPTLVAIGSGETRLPGARDEVRELARRYGNVGEVTNLVGVESFQDATSQCDVLHVAAHALVVDRSPWESGIRLAADATEPIDAAHHETRASDDDGGMLSAADSLLVAQTFQADPYVRAWQIAQLSLPAKLAVLSACETAGGRVTSGEGTLGMTAAFLSAGVPVVVSSLWAIDDRVTADIMRSFYRHLALGEPVATALRLAQLELSRNRKYAHPFFWAGFTVVGDGSMVVEIEERPARWNPALLAALGGAGLLVVTVAVIRRRRTPSTVG